MQRITLLLVVLAFSGEILAQSISVSTRPAEQTRITASITNGEILLKSGGESMTLGSYDAPASTDPSLNAYAMPDGAVIVRENIANFLVYDSFGMVKRSVSNSTQSEGGEAISELAMDNAGKTIVVYNPKVIQGGMTGSRAKVIDRTSTPLDVFYSQDRALSMVEVSANGEFLAFVTVSEGSDDEVVLKDRFGNTLNTITFDQEVEGVSFSEDGLYAVIYSGGRVAAYEILSGERVGSTSFRNTSVQFASYDPADKTIIALTANGNTTLSDIRIHAVNVAARKITRQDLDGNLEIKGQIKLERTGDGRYSIIGLDKELKLRVSF